MSYIGRQLNNLSDRVKLDSITTSATATYNLLLNSVAHVPSSAESLTVSLNGVIQAPQDSYTVSGSTITFSSTLSAQDSIDFILAERSITLQTPSAGSVGTSQLAADAVNGDKIADDSISDEHLDITAITGQTEKTSLADADKFLISDSAASGALKYVQKSNLPSGTHVKLLDGTVSSAVNHDFTGFVDNTKYNNYLVQINNLVGTQGNEMSFQFGDSGGIETTSNYWYATYGRRSGGADMENSGEGSTEAKLGTPLATTVNAPGSYLFYLYLNPENKTFGNSVIGDNWGYRSDWSDYLWGHFTISYNVAITVDRFRIHASGNDATTFDYAIYGIVK